MKTIPFRDAMTQFGSGVTIPVAPDAEGRFWGLATGDFCSVPPLAPPTLRRLARGAGSGPALGDPARRVGISVTFQSIPARWPHVEDFAPRCGA